MEDFLNNIALRQIDESNFLDCFALELAAGQEKFVSSPIRSLAQAYVYRNQCTPFGVFAGGRMVGYVMLQKVAKYSLLPAAPLPPTVYWSALVASWVEASVVTGRKPSYTMKSSPGL